MKKTNDEEHVIQKCNELLEEAGVTTVPVNLELLGSLCGISKFIEMEMDEAGRLIPDTEGYLVVLRASDVEGKKRFTKAHEIGHTIVPNALQAGGHTDDEVGTFDSHKNIEYLCDVAAAHLLMPDTIFNEFVKGKEFSLETVMETAEHFGVSIEAAALQLVERNKNKRAVVVWEVMHKPKEDILMATPAFPGMEKYLPQKQIRVKYGYGLSGKDHIPKHKSLVEDKQIIENAFKDRNISKGIQVISFTDDVGKEFYCEAKMTLEGRVISILRLP